MDGGECKPEKPSAPEGQAGRSPLPALRLLYEETRREYRNHDRANENLEKKAQSLMIATALVLALFVNVAVHETFRPLWESYAVLWAIIPMGGMIATIALCICVNRPSFHPVPIKGDAMLCHDELDEKRYAAWTKDEGGYYRQFTETYAQALAKLEETNKEKSRWLRGAYVTLALSLGSAIVEFIVAVAR